MDAGNISNFTLLGIQSGLYKEVYDPGVNPINSEYNYHQKRLQNNINPFIILI